MTTIRINDLKKTGFNLFLDEETYLNEINDNEFNSILGGGSPAIRRSSKIQTLG